MDGAEYAGVSAYWGLGGTSLLSTVGGQLGQQARDGSASSLVLVWAAALVKLVAALLPLATIRLAGWSSRRWARVLSWIEAATLTAYGLVLTVVGLLVQADVGDRLTPRRSSGVGLARFSVGPVVPVVGRSRHHRYGRIEARRPTGAAA